MYILTNNKIYDYHVWLCIYSLALNPSVEEQKFNYERYRTLVMIEASGGMSFYLFYYLYTIYIFTVIISIV